MDRKTHKVFSLFLIMIVSFAGKCKNQTPPEYRRIFDLPLNQQGKEFKQLPFDKQVDMYLYAMYAEPPRIGYASLIASNGKEVIPFLLQRLQQERGDYARTVIILAFQEMHKNYYGLENEDGLIETLKQESKKIGDSFWREESEEYIQAIVEHPGAIKK